MAEVYVLPKTDEGGGPAGVVEAAVKEVGGGPDGVVEMCEAANKFEDCFLERVSGVEGGLEESGTVNIWHVSEELFTIEAVMS